MTVHIANPLHRARLEAEFRAFGSVERVRKGDVDGVRLRVAYGYLSHESGRRLIARMLATSPVGPAQEEA